MSDAKRSLFGWTLFIVGVFALIIGIWFNHYANFPEVVTVTFPTDEAATFKAGDTVVFEREDRIVAETPAVSEGLAQSTVDLTVEIDEFNWVVRECMLGSRDTMCLPWSTLGHLVAFGGSQLMLGGLVIAFVIGRRMTWALAAFTAFIAMFELVLLVGNVASEWLNLAQGPLNWTAQNPFFPTEDTAPWAVETWRFVMLGNDVGISWAVVKDFISINYNMAALIGIIIFSVKIQAWGKPLPDEEPADEPVSPYGRPLVKGVK